MLGKVAAGFSVAVVRTLVRKYQNKERQKRVQVCACQEAAKTLPRQAGFIQQGKAAHKCQALDCIDLRSAAITYASIKHYCRHQEYLG